MVELLRADLEGDEEMHLNGDQVDWIYMLYLVGITLFTDKSATYVDVTSLNYLFDLELVTNFLWESGCPSSLIRGV